MRLFMGLMDKFKNLFTDEEIIDEDDDDVVDSVEIKEVKKEEKPPKLPTFMREKIEKEEQESTPNFDIEKDIKIEDIVTEDSSNDDSSFKGKGSFKFPIDDFEDDFIETRSRANMHKSVDNFNDDEIIKPIKLEPKKSKTEVKVADLYKDKKEEPDEVIDKRFRATPIISPIYGVLDKNYTSSDVEERKGNNLEGRRHSKSVDFDSVRKKAYGSLADDIKENLMCENCEYLKEVKDCKKRHHDEDEVSYVEEDEIEDITMDEAAENYYDYGVEYEKKRKEPKEDEDVKVVNHLDDEEEKREIPPVKSSINLLSTLKKSMGDEEEKKKEDNLELTDDLFNLIDSMYDERDDK